MAKTGFVRTVLILYTLILIWGLFFFPFGHASRLNRDLQREIHLIPLSSTRYYIGHAWQSARPHEIQLAILNIGGNILLFVPLGIFLVYYYPKLSLWKVAAGTALLAFTIEIVQLATGAGSFDVDDILLNTLGSMLGCLLLLKGR